VSTVLYVTGANPEGVDERGEGGLFAVDVGVQGVPVVPAAVRPAP
jgi:hypothetical protein